MIGCTQSCLAPQQHLLEESIATLHRITLQPSMKAPRMFCILGGNQRLKTGRWKEAAAI